MKKKSEQQGLDLGQSEQKGGRVEKVEEYTFEPIKGYPMLTWRGKRPFTATHYYPAQLKEVHGEEVEGWRNKIYWGDNLQVMGHLLKEYRGKIDLVYLDPPFDSKADYKKQIKLKSQNVSNFHSAFEEKQYSDIWANDQYLQFIYERVLIVRELLSESGSIWVHCDWHQNYRIRSILDEVFGQERFISEIIWQRTFSRAASRTINNIHDTILSYAKSSEYTWNEVKTPPSQEYLDTRFTMSDPDGRKFQGIVLTAPGISNGDTGKTWRGFNPTTQGRHWSSKTSTLDQFDRDGLIYWPASGGWPRYKRYADEVDGIALQSIWTDISPVNSQAFEDTGFPTQKPEPLLERILQIASNKSGLVMDCFMGSGTTQAVALKLGRRFIGADINMGSIQTTTKRLLKTNDEFHQQLLQPEEVRYTGFEVYNVNHYDVFRNPVEAQDLLIQALELNRTEQGAVFDGDRDGRMYKILPVDRIATPADLGELIAGLDYKAFERRSREHPNQPVEAITLVCMGHDPDLKAHLEQEVDYHLDVEVVDILRDRADLQFKRDSEARVVVNKKELVIERFYPMNLLQKLSLQKETVGDWRELVESVMIDWNYDGAVLQPAVVDLPGKHELVRGRYPIPKDAGTIRVKITDLLSESWEGSIAHA